MKGVIFLVFTIGAVWGRQTGHAAGEGLPDPGRAALQGAAQPEPADRPGHQGGLPALYGPAC